MTPSPFNAAQTANQAAYQTADQSAPRNSDPHKPSRKLTSYNWVPIYGGIILAGAVYPIVFTHLFFTVFILSAIVSGNAQRIPDVPGLVGSFLIVAFAGTTVGAIWASVLCVFTIPVVYLFVRSLNLHGSAYWFGAAWGGLVGFLGVLPFVLQVPFDQIGRGGFYEAILAVVLGPGLATVIGQIGGAWGARRAARRPTIYHPFPSSGDELEAPDNPDRVTGASFQFRVRHLLWITVWISLLLSAIRLSGIPYGLMLQVLILWLGYQMITLYVGSWILRKLARWQQGPQTELSGRIL
jgi:hypothetical protein